MSRKIPEDFEWKGMKFLKGNSLFSFHFLFSWYHYLIFIFLIKFFKKKELKFLTFNWDLIEMKNIGQILNNLILRDLHLNKIIADLLLFIIHFLEVQDFVLVHYFILFYFILFYFILFLFSNVHLS